MYGLINQPAVFMTEDDLKSRSDELLYGWAVKATGEKEDFWYVTSHYGYKGYVPKAAVTPVSLKKSRRGRSNSSGGQSLTSWLSPRFQPTFC